MGAGAGMGCVCSGWGWGRPQEEGVRLAPSPEKHRKLLALLGIVGLSFAKRSGWGPCLTTGMRAGWVGPEETTPHRWNVWFASRRQGLDQRGGCPMRHLMAGRQRGMDQRRTVMSVEGGALV